MPAEEIGRYHPSAAPERLQYKNELSPRVNEVERREQGQDGIKVPLDMAARGTEAAAQKISVARLVEDVVVNREIEDAGLQGVVVVDRKARKPEPVGGEEPTDDDPGRHGPKAGEPRWRWTRPAIRRNLPQEGRSGNKADGRDADEK